MPPSVLSCRRCHCCATPTHACMPRYTCACSGNTPFLLNDMQNVDGKEKGLREWTTREEEAKHDKLTNQSGLTTGNMTPHHSQASNRDGHSHPHTQQGGGSAALQKLVHAKSRKFNRGIFGCH
ncbi:hypothetical protein E2C01_085781 [Portunus trituberculatus]|uniref:Uncharacterized protein n=1 Tax=Portunus trituberculatus TaxID=210409 RepID=A0A5B7IZ15_PORTR|nr:hypothetical protein [Portunus trituberculatus]